MRQGALQAGARMRDWPAWGPLPLFPLPLPRKEAVHQAFRLPSRLLHRGPASQGGSLSFRVLCLREESLPPVDPGARWTTGHSPGGVSY